MCAFQSGPAPVVFHRVLRMRWALVAASLALSGCATTSSHTTAYHYPGDGRRAQPQRVAEALVEVEADGLPAQTPPPSRARQLPDDPSEPWSRNYGGENPSRAPIEVRDEAPSLHKTPEKSPAPAIPQDLPPQFRKQLAAALSTEQDE